MTHTQMVHKFYLVCIKRQVGYDRLTLGTCRWLGVEHCFYRVMGMGGGGGLLTW